MTIPSPDFERLLRTFRREATDRVPLLELLVDTEVKAAFLGKPIASVADDIEFWYRAGYDCATVAPDAPTMWYFNQERPELLAADAASATGARRWASSGTGLIRDWNDLERYPVPTLDQIDFSYFEAAGSLLPSGMGLIANWGDIFLYTWEAMGFEEFALALYEREDLVAHLFTQLGLLSIQITHAFLSYDSVKAIWFSDDIAYKTGLLVSPSVYRQHLFPWIKQIGDLAHRAGRPLIYHSDGVLWRVMEDLIACGIEVLQPIEPQAMDIREVKQRYGDRLCLAGNIDVDLLTRGTPDQIRENVRWLLGEVAPGGGFCLGSGNTVPNYVPVDNYRAMLQEALEHGRYPIQF